MEAPDTCLFTLLVVEDHTALRLALVSWLEELFPEAKIHQATTGEESVALAGRLIPDLILMDIRLPGISGIEATREILHRKISTRIVILTNHDEEAYRKDSLDAGACSFVPKRTMWAQLPGILFSHMQLK